MTARLWARYRRLPVALQVALPAVLAVMALSPSVEQAVEQAVERKELTKVPEKAKEITKVVENKEITKVPATTTTIAVTTTTGTESVIEPNELSKSLTKVVGSKVEVISANEGLEVVLSWRLRESTNPGLIARHDTSKLLRYFADKYEGNYVGVRIEGTYPFSDKYGNSSDEQVFLGTYNRDTIERINYDKVDVRKLWQITDGSVFIHPAFQ